MTSVVKKLMATGGLEKTSDGEPAKGQPRNDNSKPSPSDQDPKGVQADNNDRDMRKKSRRTGLKTYANQV